ncbi:hypothetical protein V6N13_111559 [Hibiscus sabdariffa]
MPLPSPPSTSLSSLKLHTFILTYKRPKLQPPLKVLAMAKVTSESDDGVTAKAAIAGGQVANPVIDRSLYMLKTTGVWFAPWTGWLYRCTETVSRPVHQYV